MTICVDRLYASIEQPVLITRCVFHTLLQSRIAFLREHDVVEKKMSDRSGARASAALMCSLGRTAERCAS